MTTASTGHEEPARRVAAGLGRRPDGLSGVVEIRLHGVGGTSPQSLLDDLAPPCRSPVTASPASTGRPTGKDGTWRRTRGAA
ncbi:hypothetical protein [Nonomuraea salmonea]|uniref:hypothetical protein n=1 Tax=Nonomuraea salmonea TaxID=46181 RepID=UPI0031EB1CC6